TGLEALVPGRQRLCIVQAPDLQVRQPESLRLDGRSDLRQGWQIGPRKDVALHPWIDRTGLVLLGDGVEHGDTILAQQRVKVPEEFLVTRPADMLEHAD